MKKCGGCLQRMQQLRGWWAGAAKMRKQLAKLATNAEERDKHLRAQSEYEANAATKDERWPELPARVAAARQVA